MYSNITEANNQSNNYIFWIKNQKINNDIIKYQIDNIFRRLKYIKIIGVYHDDILEIYQRK